MELRAIVDVLRRWWWLVAIPTLMAGIATLPVLPQVSESSSGYGTVLHFSAAQRSPEALTADSGLEDVWLASELAVHAIAAWARTESFRRELEAVPGVESGDIAALVIASDNHRSIGQLFLNHPDSQSLLRLATAAAEVLQNTTRNYFPQFAEASAAVSLLDAPSITPAPVPLGQRLAPLLRVALGLVAGLILVMAAHTFDPALRTREDLEMLGLPVLATLPRK
ncbi:MAG: hypothetical protein OXF63_02625 [Anaerolineaceae bacterium]|nr:hypothetical protein [Anaerolineaceae bacterium]